MTTETIPPPPVESAQAQPPVMYCANHPGVETYLRCNKCDKPICLQCAVQTPVGYRCKECVRQQQDVYYNGSSADNLVALGVAFGVVTIATPIIGFFLAVSGFFSWIIAFLAGSAAGSLLAQAVRGAVKRRRSRNMRWFALAGIILGVLAGSLIAMLFIGFNPMGVLAVWIFVALAVASALPFLR